MDLQELLTVEKKKYKEEKHKRKAAEITTASMKSTIKRLRHKNKALKRLLKTQHYLSNLQKRSLSSGSEKAVPLNVDNTSADANNFFKLNYPVSCADRDQPLSPEYENSMNNASADVYNYPSPKCVFSSAKRDLPLSPEYENSINDASSDVYNYPSPKYTPYAEKNQPLSPEYENSTSFNFNDASPDVHNYPSPKYNSYAERDRPLSPDCIAENSFLCEFGSLEEMLKRAKKLAEKIIQTERNDPSAEQDKLLSRKLEDTIPFKIGYLTSYCADICAQLKESRKCMVQAYT